MARRKKNESVNPAAMLEYYNLQLRKEVDAGNLIDGLEAIASTIGIRLPHLSLRLLFQRSSLPFERSVLIFGKTGSNKSSFMYYLYDLFRLAGGKYIHVEVEDKDTPVLRLSLTGNDRTAGCAREVQNLTECMSQVHGWIKWHKDVCNGYEKGWMIPLAIGVDSLTAKMTSKATTQMDRNDGAPERRYADEARELSEWFKYIPNHLQGWPIGLFAVNHDKPRMVNGRESSHTPGGAAPGYYATYRIHLARVRSVKMNSQGWEGERIRFSLHKSSLGSRAVPVECEIMWRLSPQYNKNGELVSDQQTAWNWRKATCEVLTALAVGKYGARRDVVRDLLGWSKCVGGRYACKALNVPMSDPIGPKAMSKLLEAAPELLTQLEPNLGIHSSVEYDMVRNYPEQVEEARENASNKLTLRDPILVDVDDGDEANEAADTSSEGDE